MKKYLMFFSLFLLLISLFSCDTDRKVKEKFKKSNPKSFQNNNCLPCNIDEIKKFLDYYSQDGILEDTIPVKCPVAVFAHRTCCGDTTSNSTTISCIHVDNIPNHIFTGYYDFTNPTCTYTTNYPGIVNNDPRTISFWVKDITQYSGTITLSYGGVFGGVNKFQIYVCIKSTGPSTADLIFGVDDGNSTSQCTINGIIELTKWSNFVITYDNISNDLASYFNGISYPLIPTSSPLSINTKYGDNFSVYGFTGKIGLIEFYNIKFEAPDVMHYLYQKPIF